MQFRDDLMNGLVQRFSRRSSAILFCIVPAALLAVTVVQNYPPIRPADANSPTLIWDIDLKLANALP